MGDMPRSTFSVFYDTMIVGFLLRRCFEECRGCQTVSIVMCLCNNKWCDDSSELEQVELLVLMDLSLHQRLTVSMLLCVYTPTG